MFDLAIFFINSSQAHGDGDEVVICERLTGSKGNEFFKYHVGTMEVKTVYKYEKM